MSTTSSKAAAILGRKGGKAGRGASQRRSPEHYRAAAQESATVRRALRAIRDYISALEPDASHRAGEGWYAHDGLPVEHGDRRGVIVVRLVSASDGGLLLGVYEWARGMVYPEHWRQL